MKGVFIGTVEFSLHMLATLIETEVEIVGAVSGVDSPNNSDYANLEPICNQHNIPVLLTNNINSEETLDWIIALTPDVIFCLGWSRLVKKELLQLPPLGVIGYHPAALPQNRGRHPLIWALVLGLTKTASTFFFMDEGADSGDILSQEEIVIFDNDDAQSLYRKIIKVAKEQLLVLVSSLINGDYQRVEQDSTKVNMWRKRSSKDGEIDWRMSASSIHNLIRGLTHPYIGAHFYFNGEEYKVWKSNVVECSELNNIEPGRVIKVTNKTAVIKCGEGCVELINVDPPFESDVGEYL